MSQDKPGLSFDEWWNANEMQYTSDSCHMSEYHMASVVWKAALSALDRQGSGKWVGRTLIDTDSYCPSCGHNRDESSVSSIDNEDGTHTCQQCGADWREQNTQAQDAQTGEGKTNEPPQVRAGGSQPVDCEHVLQRTSEQGSRDHAARIPAEQGPASGSPDAPPSEKR